MRRFFLLGLLVTAALLVGCPVNQNPSNITVEDVLGEWDFSNVTIKNKTYDNVHVSILPAPHDPESSYKNGVDLHIGDCFYMSDGDFSGNVYTGKYQYKETIDSDWIDEAKNIIVTFSLIDDKLQIQIKADDPLGSFTIQGGTNASTTQQTTPAGFDDIVGTWEFQYVLIPNQPPLEEGKWSSTLSTCTLIIKDYPPKALELKGIDQHGYDCDYYGHISDAGEGGSYQWSYFYEITRSNDTTVVKSTSTPTTITAKFSLGDGELFAEFDGDGPLNGVRLYNGVKQTEEG